MPRKSTKVSHLTPDITGEVVAPPVAVKVRDEHAEHLATLEKLIAEVAALRATIADGFDKLVAHLLEDAVEEAAETMPEGPSEVTVVVTPPAEDASKKHLAPAHDATLDDVREALNRYTRSRGLAEASKVVQSLGVKRLTELPAERYAEAVAAFEE